MKIKGSEDVLWECVSGEGVWTACVYSSMRGWVWAVCKGECVCAPVHGRAYGLLGGSVCVCVQRTGWISNRI